MEIQSSKCLVQGEVVIIWDLELKGLSLNPDFDVRHSFCDLGAPQLAFLGLSIPI